jgi:hypothetical protein
MFHVKHKVITCLTLVLLLALGGCIQWGQGVMVSKGEAGFLQRLFGAEAEFCKMTSTPGVELNEADRAAFRTYCAEAEEAERQLTETIREAIRAQQRGPDA